MKKIEIPKIISSFFKDSPFEIKDISQVKLFPFPIQIIIKFVILNKKKGEAHTFLVVLPKEERYIFRFAVDKEHSEKMEKESKFLKELNLINKSTVKIPFIHFTNRTETNGYGEAFGYHQMIEGISGRDQIFEMKEEEWNYFVEDFSSFLYFLHSLDISQFGFLQVVETISLEEIIDHIKKIETVVVENLESSLLKPKLKNERKKISKEKVEKIKNFFKNPLKIFKENQTEDSKYLFRKWEKTQKTKVCCHADIKSEHIYFTKNKEKEILQVSGLIDWTDVNISNPIQDFSGILCFVGAEITKKIMEKYLEKKNEISFDFQFLFDSTLLFSKFHSLKNISEKYLGEGCCAEAPLDLLLEQLSNSFSE